MDEDIGLWIEGLQYVWDDEKKRRLYIVPKNSFVIDDKNSVTPIRSGKELYLFPMSESCDRNLAMVYTGPLNIKKIHEKFGVNSLRKEGRVSEKLLFPKTFVTFWLGQQHTRTAVPSIFYGKRPETVKSPIVNTNTGQMYENLWELQKKKRLTKSQIVEIHGNILSGRGEYKYFWQSFKDKKAMELGRQISFVSFAFFLL